MQVKSHKGKYVKNYLQLQGAQLETEDLVLTGAAECLKRILTSVAMAQTHQFRYSCFWGPENLKRLNVCKTVSQ